MVKWMWPFMALMLISCGPAKNPNGRSGSNNPGSNEPQNTPAATDFSKLIEVQKSQIFRTRGSEQISYLSEQSLKAQAKFPNTSRLIPNPLVDNDSTVIRTTLADIECGNTKEIVTIKTRMNDCKTKNPLTYIWKSKENGISGEGDWQLVAASATAQVWIDLSTGLIWSDVLTTKESWDLASGANGNAERLACKASVAADALGSIPANEIHWRLPTRNDFLLADINGARYVLPHLDETFWTASVNDDSTAWAIEQKTGKLDSFNRQTNLLVRCVGTALK